MTTICYRDGQLAADTRAYSGGSRPIGHKQKIGMVQLSGGEILAFGISTAHPGLSEELRAWLGNEKSPDYDPGPGREFEMLEVRDDGTVFYYQSSLTPSGPLEADYFAIGSGAEYALGALAHGATAQEAVEAASQHDVWTKAPIQFINVPLVGAE